VSKLGTTLQLLMVFALSTIVGLGCTAKKDAEKTKDAPAAVKADAAGGTGPVAKVGDVEISRDAFNRQMERTKKRFERAGRDIPEALSKRLKQNIVRKLVDDTLIEVKAQKEGITVVAADLDAKLVEHKKRFGKEENFQKYLERTGQSAEDVKADLKSNMLRENLFSKIMGAGDPSEEDIKAYYEKNLDRYKQREQVKASHILFKVSKEMTPAQKKEQEKKAKAVFKKAKKADAKAFAALAKENSEGPTASRGGDLGFFSRGRMVKAFEDVAFKAKKGSTLGPVETQFGYHVIRVFEKKDERQRAYDEVKDSIKTTLTAREKSKKKRELLKKLREEIKVAVLEPGISLDAKRPNIRPTGPGGKPINPKDIIKRANLPGPKTKGKAVELKAPSAPTAPAKSAK
jgi:peptidyl-prolyl cis-trans isomerase C